MKGLRNKIDNAVYQAMGLNLTREAIEAIIRVVHIEKVHTTVCPDGSIYGVHRTEKGMNNSLELLNKRYGGYKAAEITIEE